MNPDHVAKLTGIGLTDGEARTYLALLSLGTSSVGPVIEISGISASKVYQILERLMHKGLVHMAVVERKKLFTPSPPQHLLQFLDNEKARIEHDKATISSIIPMLEVQQKSHSSEPPLELARGKRGFETLYHQLIEEAPQGACYFAIGGVDMSFKLQSLWYPFSLELAKKGIINHLIYEEKVWNGKDPQVHRRKERRNYYPKVLSSKHQNLPNIIILAGNTLIVGLDDNNDVVSFIIRNKHITESFMKLCALVNGLGTVPEGFQSLPEKYKKAYYLN